MKRRSRAALIACYVLIVLTQLYYPKWQYVGGDATISYDVSGYYMYLPAVFIYHDLRELRFLPELVAKYRMSEAADQAFTTPEGHRVLKYSAGMAIMYAPFFALAHGFAVLSSAYPADGFSLPYQVALSLASLLISFAGLYALLTLLRRYYSESVCAVTLLIITFATNYLNYSALDGALSHNYLFTLYACLLLACDRLYRDPENPPTRTFVLIGLLVGMMALIRPTEILAASIPLLWSLRLTPSGVVQRAKFFTQNSLRIAMAVLICLAIGSIQLLYWKYAAGHWLVYSYQEQGFDWSTPHLTEGILSYRAGWLTYTPVMWFALLGFLPLGFRRQGTFAASLLHTLAFIYVAFSWSVWWYGGSLGQRTMVQLYPVLAFPLAAMVSWVSHRPLWLSTAFAALCLLCTAHNLWFTHQAHRGGLFVAEWMNKPYYWRTLFTFKKDTDNFLLLDNPEFFRGTPKRIDTLYVNDFENESARSCDGLSPRIGNRAYCMSDTVQFTPEYHIPGPFARRQWIRVSADMVSSASRWDVHNSTQLVLRFYRGGVVHKERLHRLHRVLNDEPARSVMLEARAPWDGADEVRVMLWNGGATQPPVLIDNLIVTTLE
ncbi:hypothetical protein LEM8419_01365 [Neolewinella maritima]|uniref:Glycosyltransferase RgtA/B/C/D-like domain-containing protein n=1 Tax=Neolewinella maritima TaxID=1383882 RepID=A0ABM9AZM1_9BACT|nr:hypothetical protein [Neolewinella maritima]CAH1000217.1 hypothetical protein LEM8419_01365 [Neolewinella maritima]